MKRKKEESIDSKTNKEDLDVEDKPNNVKYKEDV